MNYQKLLSLTDGSLCIFFWFVLYIFVANLMFFAVPDYGFEEEASEFVNSVHIDGNDEVDDYSGEDQQPQQQDFESETELEETPADDLSALLHKVVEAEPEPVHSVEEPVGEPPKLTYASIVCTFFHFLHVLVIFKRHSGSPCLHGFKQNAVQLFGYCWFS